jgi:signal transduction histidine kinase
VLDLNALVRHVTTLMRPGLDGIEVGLELAADLAPVRLDAAQAEHALINLLVNARDAMPDGGRLTLATANVALTDGAPGWVQLTVSDSGPGIEPQALPQLFEPFFTTKPDGQGTGLGLSQVHGFVHQAGGQVEVDSEPGRGARFHLLLPQAAEEPPPQRQGAATGP